MYAQTLRQERYNVPSKAFAIEKVKVPELNDDEVLVAVMAAGLNYNSVWAATGFPMDMIQVMQLRKEKETDYHIIGSDCSGIVYKTGKNVKDVAVGDEVVIQAGWCDEEEPFLKNGGMRIVAPSARAWGYETTWGSFAQFCKVKHFMCVPKPKHLNWDAAAVYMLSGATVYRMLTKYEPHTVQPGNVVLIWGGAGGLGTMAIQLTKMYGGIPVAVVNSEDKKQFCESLGALAINRSEYDHWGPLSPDMLSPEKQEIWRGKAKKFLKKILELTGGKLPRIVLEHPGEATMPTSVFVCDREGMVITCAGTTGYMASFDIRYLWLQLKRVQGSHFADAHECVEFNRLVMEGKIQPVLSRTVSFEEIPGALQLMYENLHKGNTAVRIGY
jgi:crotonyl-CoA carboxylase/reductase